MDDDLSELARQLIEEADAEGLLRELEELAPPAALLADLEALRRDLQEDA